MHYALCTMHYSLHMYCTHCTVTAHHAHCTHCIHTQHTVCSTFHPLHKCTLSVSHWTKHCSAITVIWLTTVHYTRRSFVLHWLKEHEHWAEIILILYWTLYNPICAHCYPLTTKKHQTTFILQCKNQTHWTADDVQSHCGADEGGSF